MHITSPFFVVPVIFVLYRGDSLRNEHKRRRRLGGLSGKRAIPGTF